MKSVTGTLTNSEIKELIYKTYKSARYRKILELRFVEGFLIVDIARYVYKDYDWYPSRVHSRMNRKISTICERFSYVLLREAQKNEHIT